MKFKGRKGETALLLKKNPQLFVCMMVYIQYAHILDIEKIFKGYSRQQATMIKNNRVMQKYRQFRKQTKTNQNQNKQQKQQQQN